jgi:starch phosphorylase
MMFDVQVKRIHEYKRQLLNILHVIGLYDRIRKGDTADITPRCVLIGGKAAPGYVMAKDIIKLINNVADTVNLDPKVSKYLKVAFIPNYNVSAMEIICPATDLSEQISTAGKEASGTGNMKFMMNGALTIGTLDGANIEIREAVKAENFFLFGAQAHDISTIRENYQPNEIIANSETLSAVMHLLESGHFNLFEPGIFDSIINTIRDPHDMWLTAYDFDSYFAAQRSVDKTYKDSALWTQMSILNTAASGVFSSDHTIRQYRDEIWKL